MDYDSSIHSSGLGIVAIGSLALVQLWLPLLAVALVVSAAVAIRFVFRRRKQATDA